MKKIHFSIIMVLGLLMGSQVAYGQSSKGAMRVGGGLCYGTGIESLGIGARFDYAISDNILLAPDLVYFFGKSSGSVDLNWFDINLNGNYLFDVGNPDIIPYALAGLNFAIISTDFGGISPGLEGSVSSTEIGLNLGGGADFLVGSLIVFGELRFAISNADQLVISGGVKFPIN